MKWIELNAGIDPKSKRNALLEFVSPLISEHRPEFDSWHFLWEGKPWPTLKEKGITLRLRFYGENDSVDKLLQIIEKKLEKLEDENPLFYLGHCYGRHGDCPGEYEGEDWGEKGWKLGMKFLQFGSEVALELIENENILGKSTDYKLNMMDYAERHIHCFLNDIFTSEEEVYFYLENTIQRLCHLYTGQQFGKKHQREYQQLIRDIKLNIIKKSKETFELCNKH